MRRKDPLYTVRGYEENEDQCEYGYTLILARMPVRHQRVVEATIRTFATGHQRQMAHDRRHSIVRAFDTLTHLMPGIRDEIKRLKERDEVQAAEEAEYRLKRLTGREPALF